MSQTPACPDVPSDEPAHIDLLRGEIGAALGFGDEPVTNEQEQNVEAVLRVVQRHYRILADRASRALPSTALAARPERGRQIKPLEWVDKGPFPTVKLSHGTGPAWSIAYPPFGDKVFIYSYDGGVTFMGGTIVGPSYPTLDLAKAAAQARYETRIRSAFLAPSTPPTAGDGHD